jgi:probable rRNA maturation factor
MAHFCVLRNRQRKIAFDLAFIGSLVESALPECRSAARAPTSLLSHLDKIEATILSNRVIAKVHSEFFQDPAPTDVITFPYGEILLGAGVVFENAARFRHSPSEEAAICVIHGLLHLGGWNDRDVQDSKDMARKQEQIFKIARRMVCSATHDRN